MANTTLDVKIQIRNDTKNNWTTQNPVLLKGEMGVETEYHLIANLEQLTYQESDIKAMKELIAKMSQ